MISHRGTEIGEMKKKSDETAEFDVCVLLFSVCLCLCG